MAEIELRHVDKHFGPVHVIRDVNLTVKDKEFVVFLGPSGCGKTTTLRAIAGLEEIDTGDILLDGKPIQDLRAADRDIAFVFQNYALYPHFTVYENLAFPLRAVGTGRDADRHDRALGRQVAGHQPPAQARPSALSGGDMQRVAIGRALVRRPKALLLDEPIGSLDAKLRETMRVELKRLHFENGSTSIYVTHDQVEAMSLADRIVVMNEGVLQQVGTPTEVYLHPANLFVAQFIGSPVMNIAPTKVERGRWQGAGRARRAPASNCRANCSACSSRRRPPATSRSASAPKACSSATTTSPATARPRRTSSSPSAASTSSISASATKTLRARTTSGYVGKVGDRVFARIDPSQAHFFDTKSGASLDIRLGD